VARIVGLMIGTFCAHLKIDHFIYEYPICLTEGVYALTVLEGLGFEDETIVWTAMDEQAVSESRGISLEILKLAGSGHPGITLSMMPLVYLLYAKILRIDPADPTWTGRDIFVMSCGHASLAQYIQLHLAGFDLSIEDLKQFRQLGSKTPGHPEFGLTPGVELSTGPLGQGFAMSVGLALANKYQSQLLGNQKLFRRNVFVLVSDGDTQEGIFSEAASLANLYELDNLIVFYDSNKITIDGSTSLSTRDEVISRMQSSGWDVQQIQPKPSGDLDIPSIWASIINAKKTSKPSFIVLDSTIGWPAPKSKGTSKIHGNLLTAEETEETQAILKYAPQGILNFSTEVKRHAATKFEKQKISKTVFDDALRSWFSDNPQKFEIWENLQKSNFNNYKSIPEISAGLEKISTRKMNGIIIQWIKSQRFGCLGGSADLTESNSLVLDNLFLDNVGLEIPGDNFTFGVREHAMSAIANGFAMAGWTIPYCATYLVFSDYQKPAVRMSALMDLFVTYVWTHDSVAIGADGPTHQPIDQLPMLRGIPNFAVVRPGDANELTRTWECILEKKKPVGLILSRQDLKVIDSDLITRDSVSRGAYILKNSFDPGKPDLILIATGSEVGIALEYHSKVNSDKIGVRVVSMPCMEWFDAQTPEYKELILPNVCESRISIEAGSTFGWDRYVGLKGIKIGIDQFGSSGDGDSVMSKFGISLENLAAKASHLLKTNNKMLIE
jgi:transketolase